MPARRTLLPEGDAGLAKEGGDVVWRMGEDKVVLLCWSAIVFSEKSKELRIF